MEKNIRAEKQREHFTRLLEKVERGVKEGERKKRREKQEERSKRWRKRQKS